MNRFMISMALCLSVIIAGCSSRSDEMEKFAEHVYQSSWGDVNDKEMLAMMEIKLGKPIREAVLECVEAELESYDDDARQIIYEFPELMESGDKKRQKEWEEANKGYGMTSLSIVQNASQCSMNMIQAAME